MNEANNGNGNMMKIVAGALLLVTLMSGVIALIASVIAFNAPIHAEVAAQRQAMQTLHGQLADLIRDLHNDGRQNSYSSGLVDQQISDARAAIEKLDVSLQREMRDLNATTEAKLQGLDQRLQAEIGNQGRLLQASMIEQKKSLDANTEFQIENREKIAGLMEQVEAIRETIRMWTERVYDMSGRRSAERPAQ
jgi:TolA-binding protein